MTEEKEHNRGTHLFGPAAPVLYPNAVPIFDKMVLEAAGAWSKGANRYKEILCQYIPHAWSLADRLGQHFAGFRETPIRLVDMALWVTRDSKQ